MDSILVSSLNAGRNRGDNKLMTIKINKLIINLQGSSMPRKNEAGAPIKAPEGIERTPRAWCEATPDGLSYNVFNKNGIKVANFWHYVAANNMVKALNEGKLNYGII